jgi:hypothetical protein
MEAAGPRGHPQGVASRADTAKRFQGRLDIKCGDSIGLAVDKWGTVVMWSI